MTIERFKLSIGEDTEGYITDKIKHKTYFLRSDNVKKEITGILNQFYTENEDLKTDISVLYRNYDEYANVCAKLKKENEQLKSVVKEVIELLSGEVDVFSDKATEHDINAYIELKELDNKDAYYIATATKKSIKLLKGVVDD